MASIDAAIAGPGEVQPGYPAVFVVRAAAQGASVGWVDVWVNRYDGRTPWVEPRQGTEPFLVGGVYPSWKVGSTYVGRPALEDWRVPIRFLEGGRYRVYVVANTEPAGVICGGWSVRVPPGTFCASQAWVDVSVPEAAPVLSPAMPAPGAQPGSPPPSGAAPGAAEGACPQGQLNIFGQCVSQWLAAGAALAALFILVGRRR